MSLTGKDRKIRSGTGKRFPTGPEPPMEGEPFAMVIAGALRREFGTSTVAVKQVALLARANERAVKNWFDAKNAPNGELLVRLIEHSDDVLESILAHAHRNELLRTKKLRDTRQELRVLLAQLDTLLS